MNYLLPYSTRELLLVCFWLALALAGGATSYAIVAQGYGLGVQAPATIALAAVMVAFLLAFAFDPDDQWRPRLDPWQMQRELMHASDQPAPSYASITRYSLMYEALIMEELAETMQATVHALDRRYSEGVEDPRRAWLHRPRGLREALEIIRPLAFKHLPDASVNLRSACSRMPHEFSVLLSKAEAREIADGTTDIAVVNCGFALASGIPGAESYAEVGISNLSKRNPETGRIDKDSTGKWIKGPYYQAPDLARVLDEAGCVLDFGRSKIELL